MRSRQYAVLLVLVAVAGVVVSAASWCFLEGIYQLQQELFTHLPHALGYPHGPPLWWSVPVLVVGALLTALVISRLPGDGGHLPAKGLAPGGILPLIDLPGVVLAGLATIAFGLVLGPEAPLIAIGSGVALLTLRLVRRDAQPPVLLIVAAAGSFAALSFIFASPVIAAVILIEATGLGGTRLPLVILPGLLAAGTGTLVSIGIGSFTGLSNAAYALSPLTLPAFHRPTVAEFGWTLVLAALVAVGARLIMQGGLRTHRLVAPRLVVILPIVGAIIAGLAIAFHGATGKSVNEVLFSGQSALPGLVQGAATWSVGALLLLIALKGIAYGLSLGSFRGGPTFPAIYLGAAAGLIASHLPGFALTPAVAVGLGAAVVAVLRLPLSAVVLSILLTYKAGTGAEPLTIVGVVVAYVVTLLLSRRDTDEAAKGAPGLSAAKPAE
jgi:H+/Cl- antiporter ClcA